jgi:alpha-mannosidase
MNFTQLTILLPCYSIETFDLDCNGDDAEQLLSGWSALWHPKLLANAQKLPRWLPAVSPSEDFSGHFIVLPNCCESMLPADWLLRAETADAFVLRHFQHREDVVAAALERLDQESPPLDPDLVGDFLALGFCRLQVELLTRKLHYANNLDETLFRKAVLAAADEAIQGNVEAVRGHLQAAFDRLHEAREYFYPTSARLLDLTLVAPSTLGAELRSELADRSSRNLLVSGEAIQQMAEREPATLDALKQALAENRAALIGGEFVEAPLPLLDPEAIAFHLRRGLAAYENHLGRRPRIFGRRRFGLTPVLPAILQREGFLGAFHCTLDDGRFPTGNQSRIQWEGLDGATIEAVGSLPLDAARSETFLKLTETLSHAMTLDNASTVLFAHWPGRSSPWYDDLRRIAAYSAVLGAFVTIDDFFEKTASVGQQARYSTDQYRTPYLAQDVLAGRSDPISRWVRYFHRRRMVETVTALNLLAEGS